MAWADNCLLGGNIMKVSVSWDNDDKTAIRYDFEQGWTWSDFSAATVDGFALTRSVQHTVDSISYFKPGVELPPNALFQFRKAMANAPKNRGVTVIVGGSLFIKTLVGAFSRIYPQLGQRLLLADSLEQARTLLSARRQAPVQGT
jgi:hypothetical protein